jgi:hypothetical protein
MRTGCGHGRPRARSCGQQRDARIDSDTARRGSSAHTSSRKCASRRGAMRRTPHDCRRTADPRVASMTPRLSRQMRPLPTLMDSSNAVRAAIHCHQAQGREARLARRPELAERRQVLEAPPPAKATNTSIESSCAALSRASAPASHALIVPAPMGGTNSIAQIVTDRSARSAACGD